MLDFQVASWVRQSCSQHLHIWGVFLRGQGCGGYSHALYVLRVSLLRQTPSSWYPDAQMVFLRQTGNRETPATWTASLLRQRCGSLNPGGRTQRDRLLGTGQREGQLTHQHVSKGRQRPWLSMLLGQAGGQLGLGQSTRPATGGVGRCPGLGPLHLLDPLAVEPG